MDREKCSDMRELYGAPTGNCLRVTIALEEAELPYTTHLVNLRAGEHKQPEFLAIHPEGKVPVLREGDLLLTQSNAILFHLARQAPGKLLPEQNPEKAWERFFYFLTEAIAPNHAAFFLERQQIESPELKQKCIDALSAAEAFLADAPCMAGSSFTLADIAAFTMARPCHESLPWDRLPRLQTWYKQIAQRPSVRKGLGAFVS